jgi:hypothetical protein
VTRAGQVKATVEFMKDGEEDTEIYSKLVPVVVGHDTNGVPITSCVVEPDNGASSGMRQPKVRPLPIQQKRALELLGEAIHKAGAISPACDHIPPNVPCVSEDLWREYCYAGQIAESDKPDARRKAFGRASSELLAAGVSASGTTGYGSCREPRQSAGTECGTYGTPYKGVSRVRPA